MSREADLVEALHLVERKFESIRMTLLNDLKGPGRDAFWLAVDGRDRVRAALAEHYRTLAPQEPRP